MKRKSIHNKIIGKIISIKYYDEIIIKFGKRKGEMENKRNVYFKNI
jgi:hypothetical protein